MRNLARYVTPNCAHCVISCTRVGYTIHKGARAIMESSTDVPAATAPGDIEVYTGVEVGTSSHVFNAVQTTLTSIGIVANVYIIFVLLKRAARKVTGMYAYLAIRNYYDMRGIVSQL